MSRISLWSRMAVCTGVAILCGCFGGDAPDPDRVTLAGKVTLNGDPLDGAEIRFFNENDEVGMTTDEDGSFYIPIGALPGKYKVTISKLEGLDDIPEGVAVAADPRVNPELLPAKYSNQNATELTYTVPEQGTESANFDLRVK